MEHFYQQIEGWFSFPNFYKKAVDEFVNEQKYNLNFDAEEACWWVEV